MPPQCSGPAGCAVRLQALPRLQRTLKDRAVIFRISMIRMMFSEHGAALLFSVRIQFRSCSNAIGLIISLIIVSSCHLVRCIYFASGLSFGSIRFRITAKIVARTTGDDANVLLMIDWKLSRLMLIFRALWMLADIWFRQPSFKETPFRWQWPVLQLLYFCMSASLSREA